MTGVQFDEWLTYTQVANEECMKEGAAEGAESNRQRAKGML